MSKSPIVSVIVVNFNGREHIADCLSALFANPIDTRVEILVVENASTDNSLSIIEAYWNENPNFVLIKSPVNRGYPGGVNLGLAHAQGKYIAILNMDTVVTPDWLTQPVAFLEAHPEVGAVSPLLVLDQDENTINAIGQAVHVTGLGFNRGLGQNRLKLKLEHIQVSGIHGAAFILRKDILDRIGGLDETGFLYHEDVDISWLLQVMGYDLYCLTNSVVRHKYFLTMYPQKLYLLERNRLAMLAVHLEGTSLLLMLSFLFMTEAMMWGFCLFRGWQFIQAKFESYRWVVKKKDWIAKRKRFVRSVRARSDWQVLQCLSWGYAWDQFLTLGRERGRSKREPREGLPIPFAESQELVQD